MLSCQHSLGPCPGLSMDITCSRHTAMALLALDCMSCLQAGVSLHKKVAAEKALQQLEKHAAEKGTSSVTAVLAMFSWD